MEVLSQKQLAKEKLTRDLQQLIEFVLEQGEHNGFGDANLNVKFHNGKAFTSVASTSKIRQYKDDNTKAVYEMAQAIKEATAAGKSGSVTFTAILNKGNITRVIFDDNDQKNILPR